jgi:hypothetical protein
MSLVGYFTILSISKTVRFMKIFEWLIWKNSRGSGGIALNLSQGNRHASRGSNEHSPSIRPECSVALTLFWPYKILLHYTNLTTPVRKNGSISVSCFLRVNSHEFQRSGKINDFRLRCLHSALSTLVSVCIFVSRPVSYNWHIFFFTHPYIQEGYLVTAGTLRGFLPHFLSQQRLITQQITPL